jgi:hypothetical protein
MVSAEQRLVISGIARAAAAVPIALEQNLSVVWELLID